MQTEDGRYVARLQRRDLQLPGAARASSKATGARFRTQSDTEVILQLHALDGDAAVARLNGIFAYALWDRQRAPTAAGARSRRHQAAVLRAAPRAAWRSLPRSRRCSSPASSQPRLDERASPSTCCSARSPGPTTCSPASMSLPPGTYDGNRRWPRGRAARRYWSVRDNVPRHSRVTIAGRGRRARRGAESRRGAPAHGRRAARHVLQRRHRFEPHHRDRRAPLVARDQYVLRGLSRSRLRRERVRAHGGGGLRQRTITSCASTRREYAELLPQADLASRPAAQLRQLGAHLRREQACAPARHRRADRRRRRRVVRRLSALLHPAPAGSRSRACPRCCAAPLLGAHGAAPDHRLRKLALFRRPIRRRHPAASTAPGIDPALRQRALAQQSALSLEFRLECIRDARGARPR